MKKTVLIILILTIISVAMFSSTVMADSYAKPSKSRQALLMNENGEVLYQHNSTEKQPIASMTKIMTLLCVYDAIDSGKISLSDVITCSANASGMGGSQVFLETGGQYTVNNLIKSVVVCSANDSCVALAEHVSGSVENFVAEMNKKASELKLVATHFENPTGLPQLNHYSCAADVANMMRELIKHPHYFTCSKIWMEDFQHPDGRITGMSNTNRLVRFYNGCDGGKTGYTSEAMHCLCATAKRGDTRFIAVVVGAPDSATRFSEVSSMLDYGFANYETKVFMDSHTQIGSVKVRGGKEGQVEVNASEPLAAFTRKGQCNCEVVVELAENVKAPVAKGDVVGKAVLVKDGERIKEIELVASCDVAVRSYGQYIGDIVGVN